MKQHVIAVVGPIASGKGAVIESLQKKGFTMLSLSDVVREKAHEWRLPLTRKNLQDVGDSLRQKFGPSMLAELVAPKITAEPKKQFVVDSVRNPAELTYLKKHFNAFIVGITASPDKRFAMMQARGREWDPKTREEFDQLEARDRGVGQESYGQQVEACLKLADVVIDNNGTLQQFKDGLDFFLQQLV